MGVGFARKSHPNCDAVCRDCAMGRITAPFACRYGSEGNPPTGASQNDPPPDQLGTAGAKVLAWTCRARRFSAASLRREFSHNRQRGSKTTVPELVRLLRQKSEINGQFSQHARQLRSVMAEPDSLSAARRAVKTRRRRTDRNPSSPCIP